MPKQKTIEEQHEELKEEFREFKKKTETRDFWKTIQSLAFLIIFSFFVYNCYQYTEGIHDTFKEVENGFNQVQDNMNEMGSTINEIIGTINDLGEGYNQLQEMIMGIALVVDGQANMTIEASDMTCDYTYEDPIEQMQGQEMPL